MATFKELVESNVEPIIIARGFAPVEVKENSLEYALLDMHIKFFRDSRDESISLFIWRQNSDTVILSDRILQGFYGTSRKVTSVTPEEFVQNVSGFFRNQGSSLLSGDPEEIQRLEEFAETINREYTERVSQKKIK